MEKKTLGINKYLLAFIIIALVGISLVILGVVLDRVAATSFVKTEATPKYHPAWYIYLLEIFGAVIFLISFGNYLLFHSHYL